MVVLATAIAFAAIWGLARMATAPSLALLYSGLEPAAAGEVLQTLEQEGAVYEVRGGAIYVDAARRDQLRLALAAEGKPQNGTQGYELLDGLSGFGTTSQMFTAAYWRAKEGELARTIMANPAVRTARVHVATPEDRPFVAERPGAASVSISTAGGAIDGAQTQAMRFLVASAVPGLDPENVTIIDSRLGVISGGDSMPGAARGVPDERAALLRNNVERILEARVGPGRAIVEVNVDTVTEREQILERTFDPDSRVAISTVTEESTSQSSDARDRSVTVAGNLPDGDAGSGANQSSTQDSETREQVNFEVSETQREIVRAPGAIRRVTVAVLVDGIRTTTGDGETTWAPRPDEELEALRALVASAVGFDEARGDVITLQSLELPPVEPLGSEPPAPGLVERFGLDVMRLAQLAVLAVVAIVLGLFVLRPVLTAPTGRLVQDQVRDLPPPAPADAVAGAGDIMTGEVMDQMAVVENLELPDIPGLASPMTEAPADRLRRLSDGRPDETATILKSWIEGKEASA